MPLKTQALQTTEIGYWDGYIQLENTTLGVLEKAHRDDVSYEKTIQKIINREWGALEPEVIAKTNPPILSVRMNDEDRLLITTIIRNGKRCLVVLEVVLNHKYKSAHFLQKGVLDDFLDLNEKDLWKKITAEEVENLLQLPEKTAKLDLKPLKFYNNNFIQLDDKQKSATTLKLPLIVSGVAGSGKSVVALSMIANKRRENALKMDMSPLIYITKSKELAYEMQKKWAAFDNSTDPDLPPVLFMTYEELVEELPEMKGKTSIINKIVYYAWQTTYLDQVKTNEKAESKGLKPGEEERLSTVNLFSDRDILYQEFRLMACLTKEEYLALGKRQSLFHNDSKEIRTQQREALWAAFTSFQKTLPENHVILDFMPLSLLEKYGLVVIDESQDLSGQEITNIITNAGDKCVFFIDTHQGLHDSLSKRNKIVALFEKYGITPEKLSLTKAYRSPKTHLELINALFNMTYHLTGGIADKEEQDFIIPAEEVPEGQLNWVDNFSDELLQQINGLTSSAQFAVICTETHMKEARELFPFATILTAEECKGLEFETTLLFRPLDEDIYKEANRKLPKEVDFSIKPEKAVNRAAAGLGETKFTTPFNHLVTASSRATNTMIIYQPNDRKLTKMIESLKHTDKKTVVNTVQWENKPTTSTPEKWFALAKKFHNKKNTSQAKFILSTHLDKKPHEIQAIFKSWTNPEETSPTLSSSPQKPAANNEKSPAQLIEVIPVSATTTPEKKTKAKRKNKKKRKEAMPQAAKVMQEINTPELRSQKMTGALSKVMQQSTTLRRAPETLDTSSEIAYQSIQKISKPYTATSNITTENSLGALQRSPGNYNLSGKTAPWSKVEPNFDKIVAKRDIYIKLLETSRDPNSIWKKIFDDPALAYLLHIKMGEEQQNLFDKIMSNQKLIKNLASYIKSNPAETHKIPDRFFIENAGEILAKENKALMLFLTTACYNNGLLTQIHDDSPSLFYQISLTPMGRESLSAVFERAARSPNKVNSLKHWQAEDFFFPQVNVPASQSLFRNFCQDEKSLEFVLKILINLLGWKNIKSETLDRLVYGTSPSLLTSLVKYSPGIEILLKFVNLPSPLKISIENLREMVPDKSDFAGSKERTVLSHLARNFNGRILLDRLYPDIIQQLSESDLFDIENKASAFKQFFFQDENEKFLSMVFKERPELAEKIPAANLMEVLFIKNEDEDDDEMHPQSILSAMLEQPRFAAYLPKLFKQNLALFDEFDLEQLTVVSPTDKNGQMLFEQLLNSTDEIAQLFINSKNAALLFKAINPQTKEPYLFKLLKSCDLKMFDLLISCPHLTAEDFRPQKDKAKFSLLDAANWRIDAEKVTPLIKKRLKNIEHASQSPLQTASFASPRNTFFGTVSSTNLDTSSKTNKTPPSSKKGHK